MGTPDFAVAPLKALIDEGYNIVGVVTTPDRPSGRGQKISQSAVKQFVNSIEGQNDIPTLLQPEKLRDELWLSNLKALNAELFIVVAFRMLPEVVWKMPPMGTFNLHASLLPLYRGAAPINWAIINGDTVSGVTTFFLNEEIDKGAIIAQQQVAIANDDCAGTLHDKLMVVGTKLVVDSVEKIAADAVKAQPQPHIEDSVRTRAPKIFKDDCAIDWSANCEHICNKIRGLSPYPAAWSQLEGGTLVAKIVKAHAQVGATNIAAGEVDTDLKHYYRVSCADGWVYIDTIHPAGKKPMSIGDFLRGHGR